MVKIDKIKSTTTIQEALGKIVIELEDLSDKDNDIKIDVKGNVWSMPSVWASNCKDCDVDVNTTLDLGEVSKSCIIM